MRPKILLKKTNAAVIKANKDIREAEKAGNEAKKTPAKKPRGRPKKNTTTTTANNTAAARFPLLYQRVKEEEKRRKNI